MTNIVNRNRIFGLATFTTIGLTLLPVGAAGQEKSLKEKLIGTWLQVSIDATFPDGTKRQLFGPNPKGVLIYASDGYFSLMQSRADLPKLESSNRATATPDEAKAVVAGSIAYFGKYSVDEASKVISIDIQGSTFANQIGSTSDNKRVVVSVTANELKLANPGSASGLKLELVFKRAN